MFKIAVLDKSAEARNKISQCISASLASDSAEKHFLPQFSVRPISPAELKFQAAPELCIVGEEILRNEITELSRVRKIFPKAILIVMASKRFATLPVVEHLARLGADDVVIDQIDPNDLLRKLILLSRRVQPIKQGKIVVFESAKGGLGVTSLCAGFAEAILGQGKSCVVVDLDFETQDLSRFLQARPYLNENLQLLVDQQRPVTQEFVDQALVQVWSDEKSLRCLPPCNLADERAGVSSRIKNLLAVIESLRSSADVVLVDAGSCWPALLGGLHRLAHVVLYIMSSDPASFFAAADRILRLRSEISPAALLRILENCTSKGGGVSAALKKQFAEVAELQPDEWLTEQMPFSKSAALWPASGSTLFGQGGSALQNLIISAASDLQIGISSLPSNTQGIGHFGANSFAAVRKIIGAKFRGKPASTLSSSVTQALENEGAPSDVRRLIEFHQVPAVDLPRKMHPLVDSIRFDASPDSLG